LSEETPLTVGRITVDRTDNIVITGKERGFPLPNPLLFASPYDISKIQLSRWIHCLVSLDCVYPRTCPGKLVTGGNACCLRCAVLQEMMNISEHRKASIAPVGQPHLDE
jgi:hypothetical protein